MSTIEDINEDANGNDAVPLAADTLKVTYNVKITTLPLMFWPDTQNITNVPDVTEFGTELKLDVINMFATLSYRGGIGLAAPQVGINKNLIILRLELEKPIVMVNPKIVDVGDQSYEWEEGCLSAPGVFKTTKRPMTIHVDFQDVDGEKHSFAFSKLYAFTIQHAMDLINGKSFVDDMSILDKRSARLKINEEKKKFVMEQAVEHLEQDEE